jgi:hypothetical protein
LEASEALSDEAFPPLADGVPVAIELLSELLVGGRIRDGGAEDDAATEHESLWRRASAGKDLQLSTNFVGKYDACGKRSRHEVPPCTKVTDEIG